MYAITGISGRVGGAIAENLLAHGEQIRAIVRNAEKAARWRDRGAEIAVADVDDPTHWHPHLQERMAYFS